MLIPVHVDAVYNIGCKGNLFLNKMVGSRIIVVPKLQYKSGLKQNDDGENGRKIVSGYYDLKGDYKNPFYSWNIRSGIHCVMGLLAKDQETLHLYWLPTNCKLKVFCPSSSK